MLALARVDYSRFRELRVGLYTAMIGGIVLVLLLGQATRGSRRWIELPFFTFQPSELGKVLLIAGPGRVRRSTARAACSERQRTARLAADGVRAGDDRVRCSRTSGPRSSTCVITLAILFVAGSALDALRAARGGLPAAAVSVVLVISPAIGTPDPGGLTSRSG